MFIRTIEKKNKKSKKVYHTHKLVESVRTPNGPRQNVVLNLGTLKLPKQQWKALANRIEELITGRSYLFSVDKDVEDLAQYYAMLWGRQKVAEAQDGESVEPDFHSVDVNSVSSSDERTAGSESVALKAMRELGFFKLFKQLGFTERQINLAAISICGRLIHPGSERDLKRFVQEQSALGELLGADVSDIGQNDLYRITDTVFEHKEAIEQFLRVHTQKMFGLQETIILYDLTNTHFAGEAASCRKAKRGRSKQKQHHRPLITLGVVIDEQGFIKTSKLFDGNVGECLTFPEIISSIHREAQGLSPCLPFYVPTVVMDAGIATQDNISYIRDELHFSYVVVSRSRPGELPESEEFSKIKKGIKARGIRYGDEMFLQCISESKADKERAIVEKAKQKLEQELIHLKEGLAVKGRMKSYDLVLEKIGKLRNQFRRVSKGFDIKVVQEKQTVKDISWQFDSQKLGKPYDGSYFIRTNRLDLEDRIIWEIYVMLTTIENTFKCMKSWLGLRPNFHRKEDRVDAHIFITVLAYHLLQWINYHLKQAGLHHTWSTVTSFLANYNLETIRLARQEGGSVLIRQCTTATLKQKLVFDALNVQIPPFKRRKTIITQQK